MTDLRITPVATWITLTPDDLADAAGYRRVVERALERELLRELLGLPAERVMLRVARLRRWSVL